MIHSRFGHRRTSVALAAAALALLAPPAAGAQEGPSPDELAAVSVYREQIPTASGPRAAAPPGSDAAPAGVPLEPQARTAVREAGDESLEQAATSPAYGAPARRLPRADVVRGDGSILGAAVESSSGTDAARLLGLVLALAAISAGLGAAAARRR